MPTLNTVLRLSKVMRDSRKVNPSLFALRHFNKSFHINFNNPIIHASDMQGTPKIMVFPNIFNANFCESVLNYAEQRGFKPSQVAIQGDRDKTSLREDIRQNTKIDIAKGEHKDDGIFLSFKLKEYLQPIFTHLKDFKGAPFARFNPDMKIYKNVPGNFFKKHADGIVDLGDEVSAYTFIVFLTDTTTNKGGELYFPGYDLSLQPEIGSIVLFRPHLVHEGKLLQLGEKTQLRSDILYDISKHPELDSELRDNNIAQTGCMRFSYRQA